MLPIAHEHAARATTCVKCGPIVCVLILDVLVWCDIHVRCTFDSNNDLGHSVSPKRISFLTGCDLSSYNTPSVTTTSTSATCSGTIYTIKPSDTCQSISIAEGISTTDLLVANNLQGYCYEFPTSGSLCIPSAKVCTPYTVKAGDTCGTIAGNLTAATSPIQIISWNPALGSSCSNLANLVGYVICVSNPGGTWVNPNPVTSSTTTR